MQQKYIPYIRNNGQWVEGDQEISKLFLYYFQLQLGTPSSHIFLLDWQSLFNYKAQVDLSSLELPFTIKEIKQATFDLNSYKALSPDGFSMFFFKKYWSILHETVVKLCQDFYEGSINYERLNWVHITLIAKKMRRQKFLIFDLLT